MRVVVGEAATQKVFAMSLSSGASVDRVFQFVKADLPAQAREHLRLYHHGRKIDATGLVRDQLRFPTTVLDGKLEGLFGGGRFPRATCFRCTLEDAEIYEDGLCVACCEDDFAHHRRSQAPAFQATSFQAF